MESNQKGSDPANEDWGFPMLVYTWNWPSLRFYFRGEYFELSDQSASVEIKYIAKYFSILQQLIQIFKKIKIIIYKFRRLFFLIFYFVFI